MKKNEGHARCNAFGIKYIIKHENFDYIIIDEFHHVSAAIENKLGEVLNKTLQSSFNCIFDVQLAEKLLTNDDQKSYQYLVKKYSLINSSFFHLLSFFNLGLTLLSSFPLTSIKLTLDEISPMLSSISNLFI